MTKLPLSKKLEAKLMEIVGSNSAPSEELLTETHQLLEDHLSKLEARGECPRITIGSHSFDLIWSIAWCLGSDAIKVSDPVTFAGWSYVEVYAKSADSSHGYELKVAA